MTICLFLRKHLDESDMKIVIIIAQMLCGGAEHVVLNLLNMFNIEGMQTKFIVLGNVDFEIFPVMSKINFVQFHCQKKSNPLFINRAKVKFIRDVVIDFNTDIVLSFIDATNVLALLATRGLKIPVIISERNNPDRSKMSRIWFYLRSIMYPFATSLVVANEGLKNICKDKKFNKRIDVIPNLMKCNKEGYILNRHKKIIAVGSLSSQKRFDLLIDAFSQLHQRNRLDGYQLSIFGEGPLRAVLQKQIDGYGLQAEIQLQGASHDIFKEYCNSSIFVLCSDYEGQPNVLLEAMSCGLACIASDCDFGPREVIIPDENGLLVPTNDVLSLAHSIERLILDDGLQIKLGKKAQQTISSHFSYHSVSMQWINLFKDVVKNEYHSTSL